MERASSWRGEVMGRRGVVLLLCLAVLAASVLSSGAVTAASPAKGVIKSSGGGGMAGSIIVSDTGGSAGITTQVGDTIPFIEDVSLLDIREGDLVFIDIGACWNGYFGDEGRAVICGRPSAVQRGLLWAGAGRGCPPWDQTDAGEPDPRRRLRPRVCDCDGRVLSAFVR